MNKEESSSKSSQAPSSQEQNELDSDVETQDYEKLNDDYLRLAAEFENYKKRIVKDQENITLQTISMFALNFLPIIDSFEQAIEQDGKNKNIQTLYSQLIKTFEAIEIVEVPGVGSDFDPNLHEAMEHTGEGTNEKISEVLRKGFIFRDKLIRPALVKVSSE